MEEWMIREDQEQLAAYDGEKPEDSSAPSSPAHKRGRVNPHLPHAIFDSRAFRNNELCKTQEELDASHTGYLEMLRRYFCFITKEKTPLVVELQYREDALNRVADFISRTKVNTLGAYSNLRIFTRLKKTDGGGELEVDKSSKTPLLSWYLDHEGRFEKDKFDIYTTKAAEDKHPRNLNVFVGLRFGMLFEGDHPYLDTARDEGESGDDDNGDAETRQPFVGPYAGQEADYGKWHTLEEPGLFLWALKYITCAGNEGSFAYLVQWSAFII